MNQRIETALIVGAPLALAVLELFHPHPHDVFRLDLRTWMAVHYAQILLFPLTALALAALVRHRRGLAAALCRVGAFGFGVTWVAFDSVAGVATGILLRNAEASAAPETWRAPVLSIWAHPIMGGAPDTVPLLAVTGSLAWAVGCFAAAAALRRAGSSWAPVILLALSAVSFGVFKTHAWPGGPTAFGAQAAAAAWVRWSAAA